MELLELLFVIRITLPELFPSIIVDEIKEVSELNKYSDAKVIVFWWIVKFSRNIPGWTIIVSLVFDSSIAGWIVE